MFETNYDPIRTQEQDDEELRRQREEEQQALTERQQQMMAQDMENGANAGTGTGSTRPVEPEFKVTPVADLSKYEAKITPQAPAQLPTQSQAPIQNPQSLVNTNPQIAPVPQPMETPVSQPMSPQQMMAQPMPGPQFQVQPPQQAPVQQAPQQAPEQAPPQAPVAPMIAGNASSDVGLTPTEQAVKQLSQQQPAPQQQAPVAPIAPNTTPTPGTTSQQVAQDLENGSYGANKTSKAYDVLGSDNPDKMELGKIAYGDYAPHFRLAAEQRLDELKKKEVITNKGQKLIEGIQAGDPKAVRQLQKDINNPNEGSVGKLLLASLLGNKEAQTAELAKFGIGSTTHPYIGENGQEYMVTTDAKGRAISGISANGEVLPINELSNIAAGNLKTARTTAIHAYDSEKSRLTKERDAWVSRGLTEDQLAARGLGEDQIEDKAQSRYNDTLKQASSHGNIKRDTLASNAQIGGPTGTKPAAKPSTGGTGGFDSAVDRTMKFEGGYVENDGGRGPTNFGINSKSNPDVDVKNLTPETAKKIYKEKYWNGVSGIENLSPKSQNLIFDASVNQGVDYANNLLSKVGDDPQAIVAQREADYRALAERDPSKAKYLNNWIKRLEKEAGPEGKQTSFLDNWDAPRKGEPLKEFDKRTSVTADEIDSLGRKLYDGTLIPTEIPGRDSNVRRYAIQRAEEIAKENGEKYNPSEALIRREATKKAVNNVTSGNDHKTLVNMGTAVEHLLQFKDVAQTIPTTGLTNTSAWNTFYQRLSKVADAPEIKSKEMMAGFVAGELVKAASGGQGSMTERIKLEKELMAANTPREINAIVDNSLKLSHGRYTNIKSTYEGATKRNDFKEVATLPEEVQNIYDKIETDKANKKANKSTPNVEAPKPYQDTNKEERYRIWKEKQGIKS